jgi:hypothetical protein
MKTHRSYLACLVLLVVATGCSKTETPTAPTANGLADSADTAAADLAGNQLAAAPDPHDPCRLLQPAEVEAVLGSKLIGPPYRGSNPIGESAEWPQDEGSVCWYMGKDNRNLTVQADWENAGAISAGVSGTLAKAEGASKGMLKLQDGSEIVGDWDEAKMRGCCAFEALQGDSSVEIEFGGSLATPAQAGELANKALARLSAPLALSGSAGNAAAQKREDARYAPKDPCAYWTVADVQQLLGGSEAPVVETSGQDCLITFSGSRGRSQLAVTVTPRNGYRTFRSENATFAGFAAGINASNDGSVQLKGPQGVEGPWEAAEQGPIQFNAVRHDASVAMRQGGMTPEQIKALVGHAFDRIEKGAGK